MADLTADFKTFWGHAKKILELSPTEKEHVLIWLAGYAPEAVKLALEALARDNAPTPTPTPNAPVNAPTPIRPA